MNNRYIYRLRILLLTFLNFLKKVIDGLLGIISIMFGINIVLRFLGANPDSFFANLIYSIMRPATAPFDNLFPPLTLNNQFVIDTSLLFSVLIYAILVYIINKIFSYITTAVAPKRVMPPYSVGH